MKRIKQRGLTKKEERLGWITRGHEQQATSAKLQAPSTKLQAPRPDYLRLKKNEKKA